MTNKPLTDLLAKISRTCPHIAMPDIAAIFDAITAAGLIISETPSTGDDDCTAVPFCTIHLGFAHQEGTAGSAPFVSATFSNGDSPDAAKLIQLLNAAAHYIEEVEAERFADMLDRAGEDQ